MWLPTTTAQQAVVGDGPCQSRLTRRPCVPPLFAGLGEGEGSPVEHFIWGAAQIDCVQRRGAALSDAASPIEWSRCRSPLQSPSNAPQWAPQAPPIAAPLPRISGTASGPATATTLPTTPSRRPPAPYDAKAGPLERESRRGLQVLEPTACDPGRGN